VLLLALAGWGLVQRMGVILLALAGWVLVQRLGEIFLALAGWVLVQRLGVILLAFAGLADWAPFLKEASVIWDWEWSEQRESA